MHTARLRLESILKTAQSYGKKIETRNLRDFVNFFWEEIIFRGQNKIFLKYNLKKMTNFHQHSLLSVKLCPDYFGRKKSKP